jgi:hypothetical protein
MTKPATKSYRVTQVIVCDRPELRGETFHPVAPGHRTVYSVNYTTQTRAVREYEAILAGQNDFSTEYVARVDVVQLREGRSSRVVRRRVERTRVEPRRLEMLRNLARRCVQRGALWFRVPRIAA